MSSQTQQSTHILFSCSHSAQVPVHLHEQSLQNPTMSLIPFLRKDLNETASLADSPSNISIPIISHPSPCGRDSCYNISTPTLQRQVLDQISTIRAHLSSLQVKYTDLGTQYHSYPLAIRARCANDPGCAMAHLQFGITTQPWEEDAFFESWINVAASYSDLQRRVMSPCFDAGSARCVRKVGKVLMQCYKQLAEIGELARMLEMGVEALESARKEQEGKIVISGLPKGEDRTIIQQTLQAAGIAKAKHLETLAVDADVQSVVVVQCKSLSKAQKARKLLSTFEACGVSVEKYTPAAAAAMQQSSYALKERRFAVKDETKMRKVAFKNVLRKIWGERMSGFVGVGMDGEKPWWVISR